MYIQYILRLLQNMHIFKKFESAGRLTLCHLQCCMGL